MHPLPPGSLPRVEQIYTDALDVLRGDEHRLGCKHLRNGATVALFCVAHPGAGVLCGACARTHARRHSWAFEHSCDECGAIAATMSGWRANTVIDLDVRDTSGRRGRIVGQLFPIGIGACTDCMRGAGVPA